MSTTVTYTNTVPYTGNRPHADVELIGGSNPTYKALVDTGADYLQLPQAAMASAGLTGQGTTVSIRTAAGTTQAMTMVKNVKVKIEGVGPVTVDVLFHPSGSTGAYLGRQALLAAVKAGFNTKEWLWC